MIFHVMAQHYWDTCDGAKRAKGDPGVAPRVDTQRWVEGNDKVKVLSAIGHQTLHRLFAIVDADDYADVRALFTNQMWNDLVEILPVNDIIAQRKGFRGWGNRVTVDGLVVVRDGPLVLAQLVVSITPVVVAQGIVPV